MRMSQAVSSAATTIPGSAAIQVRESPNAPTRVTAYRGPSEKPSDPPLTNNDMASARRVERLPASVAPCGWKAAAPMPPTISSATSQP